MAGGFRAEVEVTGLDDARRIARRLQNLGANPRPLLEDAGRIMLTSVRLRFDTEKGPGGIPWPKSKRAAGKVKGKPGGKTLTDTGDLRNSIREEIGARDVAVGSDGLRNPVKALANQFGSHRQAVVLAHTRTINSAFGIPLPQPKTINVRAHGMVTNLPARPFIGIDEQDRVDILDAWQETLVRQFA